MKPFIMKDYFVTTFRSHQFEFSRVLASRLDPWYHISVTLNDMDIKYRMHSNREGIWKITTTRLPQLLYSLEAEFNDLLRLNENPEDTNLRS